MQIQTATQASKFPAVAFGLRPTPTGKAPIGMQMVLVKDEELFAEGDDAEFFYQVVSGAIRRPDRIPAAQAAWYTRFFHAALARSVYLPPSTYEVCFLSLAHDAATLDRAVHALATAAEEAARA